MILLLYMLKCGILKHISTDEVIIIALMCIIGVCFGTHTLFTIYYSIILKLLYIYVLGTIPNVKIIKQKQKNC